MTLKINTAEVEIEYIDECNILEEAAKNRILHILNQLYNNQVDNKSLPSISAHDVFGK